MHAETAAWWWLVKLPFAGYSVYRLSGTTDDAGYARLASRDPRRRTPGSTFAVGHRSRAPPVPIPNTEVKPAIAFGTVWETAWESRSLPALIPRPDARDRIGPFLCPSSLPSSLSPLLLLRRKWHNGSP